MPSKREPKGGSESMNSQPYTMGRWRVRNGMEDQFGARGTGFTEWSLGNAPGAETFVLIRDAAGKHRFVSFGSWRGGASGDRWRFTPRFAPRLVPCRRRFAGV